MSTPIRSVDAPAKDGVVVLPGAGSRYADGAESRVVELLRAAQDLSALSDELDAVGATPTEHYHLAKSRASFLRGLDLSGGLRVLEVGAGCGAVTRYLGETCALVDALEPSLPRAEAAALRTAGLPTVRVFSGQVSDVPELPTYDLVVVVGVLEYVGNGRREHPPYVGFLASLRKTLVPGGVLICAIENQIGVKYLAGAPEDHTGRPFEGLEGYRWQEKAHTFSRRELQALFRAAEFDHVSFIGAFPDYKATRCLLADDLYAEEPALAWRIPRFPSADWGLFRPHLADEFSLWRTLVGAGMGPQCPNSFVVLASNDEEAAAALWPDDRIAAFVTAERAARFATRTLVRREAGTTSYERTTLGSELSTSSLRFSPVGSVHIQGVAMMELCEVEDDAGVRTLLRRWHDMLKDQAGARGAPALDCVPFNIVVADTGQLHHIDDEWGDPTYRVDDVLARGVLWTALQLADRTLPERWPSIDVTGLAHHLGAMVGLDSEMDWLEQALQREAFLQGRLSDDRIGVDDPLVAEWARRFREWLSRPLRQCALGDREHELRLAAEADLVAAEAELASTRATAASLRARVTQLETDPLRALRERWWSASDRLLPVSSRRRRVYALVRRATRRAQR